MSTTIKEPSQQEWQHEIDLFQAFCDRCGRNPLCWSVQTRRLFRKQVQRCRKHDRAGAR
ncbi:hypothetical protein [Kitasatospora kifunensis]|uniref:Uncharacterized protein n=1 Tax=Kitasatospora kifunensis TaxID=58351 RepID=A0A7W7VU63_KITKI|nr:hypothetical protein [Kitasatospora kifunensis]MBB4922140.1 hypothetical protein [Kitasatospora kifunensis]